MNSAEFSCRICGNSQGNICYTGREMMLGLRHTFEYVECARCKCVQIKDIPEDMSPYYPQNYYSFRTFTGAKFRGFGGWLKRKQYQLSVFPVPVLRWFNPLFAVKHYDIFQGLKVHRGTRILDVGCGNGRSFLFPLAEVGFTHIRGCDPFIAGTLRYDNGLVIDKKGIADMEGPWDIITWHHSFEHIPGPLEELRQAQRILAPGGVCIIRIPTASSYAWEHYRTHWAQLDAPRHFFLHSRESMNILAGQSGFRVTKVVYDSTHFQFTGSEKYVQDISLATPRRKGFLNFIRRKSKKAGYRRRARQLNREGRGDQAAFFLQRLEA